MRRRAGGGPLTSRHAAGRPSHAVLVVCYAASSRLRPVQTLLEPAEATHGLAALPRFHRRAILGPALAGTAQHLQEEREAGTKAGLEWWPPAGACDRRCLHSSRPAAVCPAPKQVFLPHWLLNNTGSAATKMTYNGGGVCALCLEPLAASGAGALSLPCGHAVGAACLLELLQG